MKNPTRKGRGSDKPSRRAGEAKRVAPSSATGNKGGRFENRVQATKLLAMCIGCPTAGLPDDSRVVELRFQARVHGRFTDDLVCTVESSAGQRSRALMQMKSGLTARKSDTEFTQAVGNAWLDFQATDFEKGSDVLLIVHDMSTKGQMRGVDAVATVAKSSLTSADWLQKLLDPGAGNEAKRSGYVLIKAACDLYAKRDCSPDELHAFLAHVHFIAHDLDSDTTAECKSYLQQIQTTAPGHAMRPSPPLVWSKLVTACMELNEHAGAVDHDNLKDFIGSDLAAWFAVHRSLFFAGAQAMVQLVVGHAAPRATVSTSVILSQPRGAVPLTADQEHLPAARESSANKYVSAQLDHINAKIKALQYTTALSDIEHLGTDQTLFDGHQKARWHLMRGVCYWHLHGQEDAASEFIKAADLCEDDDKLAAARARAHLLRKEIPEAIATAQLALERFPNSLSAWLVLANAQMNNGKAFTEADIPAVHRDYADPLQLVAWSLKASGKGREAAAAALKALALPDAGFFVADASLAITLENAAGDGLNAAFRMFDEASRADLATAAGAFEPRVAKLWGVQAPEAVAETAARLGIAYLLLGRHEDGLAVFQESQARAMKAQGLFRLGIEALAATGKPKDALALGRRTVDDMPAEALVAYGQLASREGDIDAINTAIQSAMTRALEERALNALRAQRWEAMLAKSETRTAALGEIREQLAANLAGASMPLLAISGSALLQYGEPREADAVLERVVNVIDDASDTGEIYLAAMLQMQAKRFAQAAEFLDRVLVAGQLSELHTYRLQALLRSGQLAKARQFVKGFPMGWAFDDDARHLAMELGQRASDWDFLATLVEPQINRDPEAAVSWNFKFYVAAHRDEESLKSIVDDTPEVATGSTDEVARLAGVEMTYGDREKAMRRLYRMRRARLDDTETAAAHLAVHLMAGGELPLLHGVPERVGPGTSLLLRDPEGHELVRTIDPADCQAEPLTEEFRHAHSKDVFRLLGLRVGDSLVISEQLTSQARTYKVVRLESAYRRLLDLSGRTTAQSLNPSKIVSVMSIRKDEDGHADFTELKRELQEQSANAKQVFEIYRTSPITLGSVAKMLGRDVIEVARGWQQQDVPLFVGGGMPQEREAAAQLLGDPDARFVIDAPTLAELATIECLDCLATLPQVLVTTRTRDLIARKLAEVRVSRHEGTAFEQDGQLGFVAFTDAQRVRQIQYFEAIVQAISRHCEVMPAYGPDDITKVPIELRRALSGEEYAVVLLGLQENAHVLSMDARLRNLAAMFGIRGAWPQVLLMRALEKHELGVRDYSVACLKMFFANRSFISLRDIDLTVMVHQGENWLDFGIRKFANLIAEGEIEFESALRVSMQFLGTLFRFGNCQLGVISQLLGLLVSGLKKHRHTVDDLQAQVTERLIESLGTFGERRAAHIEHVVALMFEAVDRNPQRQLRVSVLKVASPPFVMVRKELPDATAVDVELSQPDKAADGKSGAAADVTSAAPDSKSEGI